MDDDQVPAEKRCTKCGEVNPLDEFHRDPKAPGGRSARCAQCRNAASRRWHVNNLEKANAYGRRWAKENREKHAAKSKRWRDRHLEYDREKKRRWAQENPEKQRIKVARRRAKKLGAETDGHSLADLHAYWEATGIDKKVCYYCDGPVEKWKTSEGDHMLAISREGPDVVENLVPCCKSCNSSKHDRLLFDEWVPPNCRDEQPQLLPTED